MSAGRTPARVLVIAPHGSYRTAPFIHAAHRLGVQVLIASEGQHSIVSDYARGLHLNPRDPETALQIILNEADKGGFSAIIGTDDGTLELAAAACRALGLPHNPPQAVKLTRRKDLAREQLQRVKVAKPLHRLLDLRQPLWPQADGFVFPAVIKPIALSASRGVIRVNNQQELEIACQRVQQMLACEPQLQDEERTTLLLEEYIPGVEVAVEGMLYDGELQLLSVFDKPDPLEGPYFEETYYITPSKQNPTTLQAIHQLIEKTCDAYGLQQGPVHAECRINDQGVWLLEVAARTIGGLCGRLLQFGTGYSLEELVLAQAMGQRLESQQTEGAAGVLMIPIAKGGMLKRVEGLLAAQQIPYVEDIDIQIREGYEVVPLPEGASYLGFIFARAPTPDAVEAALREAHACLNIVIAPLMKVKVA